MLILHTDKISYIIQILHMDFHLYIIFVDNLSIFCSENEIVMKIVSKNHMYSLKVS